MNARYYEGSGDRRWLYAVNATTRCPYAEGPPAWMEDALAESEENTAAFRDKPTGLDLGRVFKRAHSRSADHTAARCGCCGSNFERVGYRAWCEEPWPKPGALAREVKRQGGWANRKLTPDQRQEMNMAVTSALSTRALNLRLGATHRQVKGRNFATKKEAIAWAREQASLDRNADKEEVSR